MKKNLRFILSVILLLCLSGAAFSCNRGQVPGEKEKVSGKEVAASSPKADQAVPGSSDKGEWPCFHGKDRSNKSKETGLLKTWPQEGPVLLQTLSGLGEGYSSVSIADGMIFSSGTYDNQTYVYAFDLEGKPLWKQSNGAAWKVEVSWARGYDGPRSTPTYDSGVVYHLSELNKLTAYDAHTGKVAWTRDLMADFATEMPEYGFTESVLIDGEKLYVRPAGKKGFQVCLNKKDGKTVWIANDVPGGYGYNSPILYDFGGYRQLISASSTCYYGVDAVTGKFLWKVDFENQHKLNCTDAIAFEDKVFITNGAGGGSKLIQLVPEGKNISAKIVWETTLMDNYHGGVIYHEGYFYGSGDRNRGWFSLDMNTGKQMWKYPGSMGSLTYADGMLYLLDEKGTMRLVKATPASFEVAGEFKVPKGGNGPYWAHPVVCNGKLYLRHADKVYVYKISI